MFKNALIDLIRKNALIRGEVELASGQKSDYYIDMSKCLTNYGINLISQAVIDEIDYSVVDTVGGFGGSVSIMAGILMRTTWPLKGFSVRKEAKAYGKGGLIDGNLDENDSVLLVEDVTTTGNSLLKAFLAVEKIAKVKQIITIIDREQGAKELFKDVPFKALINVSEIL